jgi:hypothetical protein
MSTVHYDDRPRSPRISGAGAAVKLTKRHKAHLWSTKCPWCTQPRCALPSACAGSLALTVQGVITA